MSRRRVAVEFIAEMARFRRDTRGGADDVRKLKDESQSAQTEVGKVGSASQKAGAEVSASAHRASSALSGLRKDAAHLEKQINDTKNSIRDLAREIAKTSDEAGRADLVGKLGAQRAKLRELTDLRKLADFGEAGNQAGEDFGDGFERGSRQHLMGVGKALGGALGGVGKIGGALPWQGLAAIPVGAAAAAASLQVIPPALAAIGGGLGALPSLAAGSLASIGTLKLGLVGVGDSIGELFKPATGADPFDSLSRNAQAFVTQIDRQKDSLIGLRQLAQDRIFAGLDQELAAFSKVALPFATAQVTRFGDTWNQTFKQMMRLGSDPQFLSGLDVAFGAADGFFDKVNDRIPTTGRLLSNLFVGSVPFVDKFGSSLLSYVDDFDSFIARQASSGGLDRFFTDAAEQADALLDIGKEIFRIVGKIGGMEQGSTLFRDMADALQRFNDEAHSMESLEGIVDTGNAAIKGLVDVLMVLGETLGETLADSGTRAAIVLFFDVLTAGAQVVGVLAQLFGLLPDSIQSVVLAGIGLAIVGTKIFSAFEKVTDAVSSARDTTNALRDMGPAGETAANGLGKVAEFAGTLGAVGAAALAGYEGFKALGDWIDSWTDPVVRDVGKMTESLQRFGESGQVAGELAKTFGTDLAGLGRDLEVLAKTDVILKKLNKDKFSTVYAGRGAGMAPLAGVKARAEVDQKQPHENLKAVDEALAKIVGSGNATAAKIAFEQLAAASGLNVEQLPKYAEAINGANAANSGLAFGFGTTSANALTMGRSLDEAIAKGQTLLSVWQQLNGAAVSSAEAEIAAEEAVDSLSEAFDRNGKALNKQGTDFDINTAKGRENKQLTLDLIQVAADAAQKKLEETESIEDATGVYDTYIGKLRATLAAQGMQPAQIDAIIAKYASMPRPINDAANAVNTLGYKIKTLPNGKKIIVDAETGRALNSAEALVRRINAMRATIMVQANPGGGFGGNRHSGAGYSTGQRWGGVVEHAEIGLLREAQTYSPRNPGRYMMAEPATLGEAFIPKNGNRERSISIGRRAMEWYGMDVVPKGAMQAVWGTAMSLATSQAPAGPVTYDNRAYIYPQKADFTTQDLERAQRRQETRARVGRPR